MIGVNRLRKQGGDVTEDTARVARLLGRAQCGEHDEAVRLADAALLERAGGPEDGSAGMHFVRFVALLVQGRSSEAIGAIDLMLESAELVGSMGWPSFSLSGRSSPLLLIGKLLSGRSFAYGL